MVKEDIDDYFLKVFFCKFCLEKYEFYESYNLRNLFDFEI